MNMKLLFVMDPLARLQIAGDSTFALMLAAQARNHEIWFCEPRHLSLEHADAVARAWPVTVRRGGGDPHLPGPHATVPLRSRPAGFLRQDPPFDLVYYFPTLLLRRRRRCRCAAARRCSCARTRPSIWTTTSRRCCSSGRADRR